MMDRLGREDMAIGVEQDVLPGEKIAGNRVPMGTKPLPVKFQNIVTESEPCRRIQHQERIEQTTVLIADGDDQVMPP